MPRRVADYAAGLDGFETLNLISSIGYVILVAVDACRS